MTDLRDRLQSALGSSYRLTRELGGGGMSRVFLAEEVELGRKVVVKVLPPEMGAGVNAERFRREIQLAASLQHPHIVPLLHAGHADDLVYYTMPFIEGDSLRVKLTRESELPIPETVRILRDVADALAHAHAHGVVHRDIKPDNVLISGHHAVVTDFGVAKAVSEATGQTSLTSLGVALGTPAYMAPEQAAADPHVDHRADIYALGALAYEMLTGRPPFTGTSPQAVLAAQVTQAPEPLAQHRAAVPPGLAALVMRCLEKKAADRWQSAAEVHQQLEGMATPSGGTTPTAAVPVSAARRPPRRAVLAAAALVVAGAGGVLVWRAVATGDAPPLDHNVVAVLPFRVAGADPSLHYLREGMIDLLAAKLTGEGGPRAADPRTVTSAWRRAVPAEDVDLPEERATALARELGAGQLLLGSVVGSPGHFVLSATLLSATTGATRAQATVEGPPDSLPASLDRLVAQLLTRGAALGAQREASLTTTSLEALRAYLAGQAAYRRGNYDEAARSLGSAVAADSTFALAAFSLVVTSGWTDVPDAGRAVRLAWVGRDRLSARDRMLLQAYLGPRYPARTPLSEELAARERAVALAPDQPDAWYFLGDMYFHEGRYLGYDDWIDRSAAAFRRALALDSTFAGPLGHMVHLAIMAGDTLETRRVGELFLRTGAEGGGGSSMAVRFDMAHALRDSALLRNAWAADAVGPHLEPWVPVLNQQLGIGLEDGDSMLAVLGRWASTEAERAASLGARGGVLMNRGRPRQGSSTNDTGLALAGRDLVRSVFPLLAALYWDADTTRGEATARRLAPLVDAPPGRDAATRERQYAAACLREQWRLARGDAGTTARTIARLRAAATPADSATTVHTAHVCAALLDAMRAVTVRQADAATVVERVDSLMRADPPIARVDFVFPALVEYQNLAVARLFAAVGDPARGLATARRGGYFGMDLFVSSYLREQGRLAALSGDRDAAIRAYRHYLALRTDPEPALRPQVEQVKAELARLVGEN